MKFENLQSISFAWHVKVATVQTSIQMNKKKEKLRLIIN